MDPAAIDPLYVKGAAGILGGAIALTLNPPKSRLDFMRRMFVSGTCGVVFPGPTLRQLGVALVDPTGKVDVELILAVGLLWGLVGWFILGLVVRFFTNRQDKDLLETAKEIKDAATGNKS